MSTTRPPCKRHVRAVLRFAQSQRDVVSRAEMFLDQRRQIEVRQDIAAVRQ